MLDLLDVRAPRLDRALRKIAKRGGKVVLIDGIPTACMNRRSFLP
ncbi:hypothetical protein ABZX95_08665 [Streptomyces sp. NPDC004232]